MDYWVGLQEILSGALRLQTAIYENSQKIAPLNEAFTTLSSSVLKEDPIQDIVRLRSHTGVVQFVSTQYRERFVYYSMNPGYEIFIGPFLLEPIGEGFVANIIRSCGLSIRRKNAMYEYYTKQTILTEQAYFYIGKLLETLLEGRYSENTRPNTTAGPTFFERSALAEEFELFEHPPYFLELEMRRLITTGNMEDALGILSKINTFSRAVLAPNQLRSLKNSLICNCAIYARSAIEGGIPSHEAFHLSDNLINRIEEITSIHELVQLEKQSMIEFVQLVHDFNVQRYSAPIRRVLKYMNYHLTEKLSLLQLAQQVYLNPNYLSSLFKKEVGVSFSRYLIIRRVEEAKALLQHSNHKVSEIASFYQFCSQSHFISCFKAETGMTPSQYRNTAVEGDIDEKPLHSGAKPFILPNR